jgi:hypothetical protein
MTGSFPWIRDLVLSLLSFNRHLQLTFLRPQYHRLLAHSSDQVERFPRPTPHRQLLHILRDPPLDHLPQRLRDREEPIRRAQPLQRLVRPLVVVELHPQPHSLPRLLEAVELRPLQELLPDRFPEPLDLAQRHRVMRPTLEVVDPIFFQFLLEARHPPPTAVLTPLVGEHLLGHAVLGDRRPIDLQHVLRGLAAEQIQPD